MNFTISKARYLAAASVTQAKKDVRYFLNGVCIQQKDNGNLRLISTDGHQATVLTDVDSRDYPIEDFNGELIVNFSTDQWRTLKAAANLDKPVNFTHSEYAGTVKVQVGDSIMLVEEVSATYPNIDRVMPSDIEHAVSSIGFNPVYMANFAKVAKFLELSKTTPIALDTQQSGPALVRYTDYAKGLLMPCRLG